LDRSAGYRLQEIENTFTSAKATEGFRSMLSSTESGERVWLLVGIVTYRYFPSGAEYGYNALGGSVYLEVKYNSPNNIETARLDQSSLRVTYDQKKISGDIDQWLQETLRI
jgi:hypothetical protein